MMNPPQPAKGNSKTEKIPSYFPIEIEFERSAVLLPTTLRQPLTRTLRGPNFSVTVLSCSCRQKVAGLPWFGKHESQNLMAAARRGGLCLHHAACACDTVIFNAISLKARCCECIRRTIASLPASEV